MSQNSYIKSLDGFRFLAVFLVLIDHWSGDKVGFPSSYLGVCLFFVLSGFLITGIILKAKAKDEQSNVSHWQSIKTFYIRRTLRIFPLYYLVLFMLFIFNVKAVRDKIVWLILYSSNIYIAKVGHWLGSIDHLWSLAVEEQFYIFFPFFIFFLPLKRILHFLIFVILVAIVLRYLFFINHQAWVVSYVLMPTCLDAFGIGGVLAYLKIYKSETLISFKHWGSLFLLAFFSYILLINMIKPGGDIGNFLSIVFLRFFESLLAVTIIGNLVFKQKGIFETIKIHFFENRFIVYFGKISYGIYIFHNLIYNPYHAAIGHPINKLFAKLNLIISGLGDSVVVRIGILLTMVICVASVSWQLIEKPVNNLKDRFNY